MLSQASPAQYSVTKNNLPFTRSAPSVDNAENVRVLELRTGVNVALEAIDVLRVLEAFEKRDEQDR